jgi:hypothetical protein
MTEFEIGAGSVTRSRAREDYHRRSRGPSRAPMKAQINIATLYQTVMEGIVSLSPIECVSGCPESSSEPEISNRVGAPSRSAHIRAANRMAAKDNMQRKQRGEEIWLAPKRHLYPGL